VRRAAPVLGLASLGLAVFLLTRPRTAGPAAPPVPAPEVTPLRCDFAPGDRLAFEVRIDGSTEVNTDVVLGKKLLGKSRLSREVTGLVLWRVLPSAQPGPSLIAGRLVPSAVVEQKEPVPEARRVEHEASAFFTVDARCRFTGVTFEASAQASAREAWEGLLIQAQVVAPEDPAAEQWTAEQTAGVGEARMAYRRVDVDTIGRRVGRLLREPSVAAPSVVVRASRASAKPDPRGAWLASLSSELDVEERRGGSVGVRSEVRVTLRRVEAPEHPFFAQEWATERLEFRALGAPAPAPPPRRPHDDAPLDESLRGASAEALAAEAWSGWQSPDWQRKFAALRMLALSVRERPGLAQRFAALILGGKLPDAQAALLMGGLRDACTREATAALRALASDRKLSLKLRRAAVMNLGASPAPDHDTAEALLDVVQGRAGAALRDQGKLAAGQLLASEALPVEDRERLHAEIERVVAEARDPVDQINALRAAENSGDPSFRGSAEAQLRSDDVLVRRAAWEAWVALGKEEKTPASALLRAAGEGQADERLFASFERWLADPSKVTVDGEDLRLAAGLLRGDSPPAQRALAIVLLGRAGGPWKQVLRGWYPDEPVGELKVRIGRYLTHDELFR
jgi:hypothetical protein